MKKELNIILKMLMLLVKALFIIGKSIVIYWSPKSYEVADPVSAVLRKKTRTEETE